MDIVIFFRFGQISFETKFRDNDLEIPKHFHYFVAFISETILKSNSTKYEATNNLDLDIPLNFNYRIFYR